MKTIKYTLAKFMVAAIVAVVLVGCKKENEPQNNNNGNPTEVAQQQNGDAVKRLLKFNKEVQLYRTNPNMKSAERLTVKEALVNLSDLFNATYTQPEESYSETMLHEFSLALNVANDETVLLTDVLSVYEQAVETARDFYNASGFANKGYINLLVEAGERHGNTLPLYFTGRFGLLGTSNSDFETDWIYSHNYYGGGSCDGSIPTGGADVCLMDALNDEIIDRLPQSTNVCRNIYLEQTIVDFDGTMQDRYPGIFYRENPNGDYCISAEELNELYAAELHCVFVCAHHTAIQNDPNSIYEMNYDWYPLYAEIEGDEHIVTNDFRYITHKNTITFGKQYNILQTDLPLQRLGN